MKLRLTQVGFESYTGQMGVLDFVDGLSTTDVDQQRAARLAAVMLCEWDGGVSPGVAQSILDNSNTAAPIFSDSGDGSDHDRAAATSKAVPATVTATISLSPTAIASVFTLAQLEAVADAEGIRGLRVIADAKGIKSNSIRELIDAILKAG